MLSLTGGRAFDDHSLGVGNLIASFDFMLRVMLIPRGLISHGRDGEELIFGTRASFRILYKNMTTYPKI